MKPYDLPDAQGHFGPYGGTFVAETLMHALQQLREAYEQCRSDPQFQQELQSELTHYVGRPSPIYHARRWSAGSSRTFPVTTCRAICVCTRPISKGGSSST